MTRSAEFGMYAPFADLLQIIGEPLIKTVLPPLVVGLKLHLRESCGNDDALLPSRSRFVDSIMPIARQNAGIFS